MMGLRHHLDSEVVGDDVALESPLLAQNLVQQPAIHVRWHAVDLVVGGHHAAHARLLDRGLEGHKEVLADYALGDVAGRGVGAALGLGMHGEVLGGGHHVMAVDQIRVALQALDSRDPHPRYQIGVLAIGLLRAAPAGIARNAEHRRKDLANAARASLVADCGEDPLDQRRIPGAGQRQRRRKAGAAVLHQAMQSLAIEQRRNAQARFLALIALHSVAQNRRLARGELHLRAPGVEDHLPCRLAGIGSRGVDHVDPALPAGGNLVHLFLQRHPRQQIGHPVLDGQARVFVAGHIGRHGGLDSSGRRCRGGWLVLVGRLRLAAGHQRQHHQADRQAGNQLQPKAAQRAVHHVCGHFRSFPSSVSVGNSTQSARIKQGWFTGSAEPDAGIPKPQSLRLRREPVMPTTRSR